MRRPRAASHGAQKLSQGSRDTQVPAGPSARSPAASGPRGESEVRCGPSSRHSARPTQHPAPELLRAPDGVAIRPVLPVSPSLCRYLGCSAGKAVGEPALLALLRAVRRPLAWGRVTGPSVQTQLLAHSRLFINIVAGFVTLRALHSPTFTPPSTSGSCHQYLTSSKKKVK